MVRSLAALSLLLVSTTALAQRPAARRGGGDANAWDVNAPPGAAACARCRSTSTKAPG